MPRMDAITLIVADPSAVARRLAEAFGWETTQDYGSFAEVTSGGGPLLWLNVPTGVTDALQRGVIMHCQVDDVGTATARARSAGAAILREPMRMDFGVESAWAQVEGGPLVDLYRPLL